MTRIFGVVEMSLGCGRATAAFTKCMLQLANSVASIGPSVKPPEISTLTFILRTADFLHAFLQVIALQTLVMRVCWVFSLAKEMRPSTTAGRVRTLLDIF